MDADNVDDLFLVPVTIMSKHQWSEKDACVFLTPWGIARSLQRFVPHFPQLTCLPGLP